MTLTRLWLRWELRLRWRSLAVLALLVAVSTGVALTAAAGARRGDTALSRLESASLPATAQVNPHQAGLDWDRVRALPEVAALGTYSDSGGFAIDSVENPYAAGNPITDARMMHTIERPAVLQGRVADPGRADEATVTARFVEMYRMGVGDTVTARLYSADQARQQVQLGAPAPDRPGGPVVKLRIVGVVRSPWYSDNQGFDGSLYSTPALVQRYPQNIVAAPTIGQGRLGALVRLRGGDADLPAFQAHVAQILDRPGPVPVRALSELAEHRRHSTTFEAAWLAGLAAAAALASLLLIGLVAARQAVASVRELQALRAVGMTPAQVVWTAASGPLLATAAGGLVGTLLAAIASRWFPLGTAVTVEPDPGVAPDLLVLLPGLLVAVLIVGLVAAVAASWALVPSAGRAGRIRPSPAAGAAARGGMPVSVVMGTRFALETDGGRPVRPAVLGAVIGVTGALAALTLAAAVSDASSQPDRFGQSWRLQEVVGVDGESVPGAGDLLRAAASDRDVGAVNDTRVGSAQVGRGGASTEVFSIEPVGRPLPVVLTGGRVATSASEVVLAPETAELIGARTGSVVRVAGGAGARQMTVSGIGFVPDWSAGDSTYARGAWLTGGGFDTVMKGFDARLGLLGLRSGADPDVVLQRLNAAMGAAAKEQGVQVESFDQPFNMTEVARISRLPLALGAFLALLAVGAVGHALMSTRQRRHDLAVLRALGMTPAQARSVPAVQACVLALLGLAFGVPLGLAAGRTVWRVVADFLPLHYQAPWAGTATLLAIPAAVVLALLLAAWPARTAAGSRLSDVLRAE